MILELFSTDKRKLERDIDNAVNFEEKRANFITDFVKENKVEDLKFAHKYFDKSIASIEQGISVLENNKEKLKRGDEYLIRLKKSLETAKSGKDIINI